MTSPKHVTVASQEIPENGADVPHLEYLHGPFMVTGTDLRNSRASLMLSAPFN